MLCEETEEMEKLKRSDRKKGYAAAVFFSVLVGFSFLGIKVAQASTDSLNVLVYRYDFAFVAIIILILLKVIKIDIKGKPKKKLMTTAAFYVGFMALQVTGLMFATSVEGSIYFAIIPIIVKIIASIFLGEKSSWLENAFVCLTVAALVVMLVMGSSGISFSPLGTGLLLASSVSMALSNVFMRYTRTDYKPIETTFTIIMMGFIAFNVAFIIKGIAGGQGIADYFTPLTDMNVFIACGYLGIGCILLSAHLMSYMLSKMEAVKGTIFGNVSTAISIVAGVVILGEPLMWYHVVCTALIIVGVVGLSVSGGSREKKTKGEKDETDAPDGKQDV